MGPLIKVLLAVSLAVLFVQCGADGPRAPNAKLEDIEIASTASNPKVLDDVEGIETLPKDEKRTTELQALDLSIDDIVNGSKQHLDIEEQYVQKISRWVARASKVEKVGKIVKRFMQVNRRDIGQTRDTAREVICDKYRTFKSITELVEPSDPELIEPCYKNKLEPTTTHMNNILAKPKRNYHRIRRQQKELMKQSEGLSTLQQWQEFFENKVKKEAVETYDNELNNIKEASVKALKTIYNAIIVWKKLDVDMKDGLKYPNAVDEKVELVQAAINTGARFGCEAMSATPQKVERAGRRKKTAAQREASAAAQKKAAVATQRAPAQVESDD